MDFARFKASPLPLFLVSYRALGLKGGVAHMFGLFGGFRGLAVEDSGHRLGPRIWELGCRI